VRSGHSELAAEVYQMAKPLGRSYRDAEYYRSHLAGAPGKVLEVACGTGRLLLPLLEAGVDAEGLDHSPAMLAICRELCGGSGFEPVLHLADMARFDLPGRYQAVFIGAGSIKELPGREPTLRALECCRAALVTGGEVYVDLVPQRHVSLAVSRDRPTEPLPPQYWRRERTLWTVQTMLLDYDAAADCTTALRRYEKWQDGCLVASELHEFYFQHWSLSAFEDLMYKAGFKDVSVTADYTDGAVPGARNEDWTFRGRK
jgi:SAM-dependent methyltransferase